MNSIWNSEFVIQSLNDWHIDYHEVLDSTNKYAINHIQDFSQQTIVIAESQLAGKGRGQHQWWSSSGALTISLVIKPSELGWQRAEQSIISLVTAIAIRDAILAFTPENSVGPRLKWPNDIYLDNQKLCGILLEVPAQSPDHLVIGIGLNVANDFEMAPEEMRNKAISLNDYYGQDFQRHDILISIVKSFERWIRKFSNRLEELPRIWGDSDFLSGSMIVVETPTQIHTGIYSGINESGALLIRTEYGMETINSGEIASWTPI